MTRLERLGPEAYARVRAIEIASKNRQPREMHREYQRNRYRSDPTKFRNDQRRLRGLPEASRPCPAECEGCGGNGGKKGLHLDHDHEDGSFRGWLCVKCNMGIGLLGDSVEQLEMRLAYLKRARGIH